MCGCSRGSTEDAAQRWSTSQHALDPGGDPQLCKSDQNTQSWAWWFTRVIPAETRNSSVNGGIYQQCQHLGGRSRKVASRSMQEDPGQLGLHTETLSQKTKQKQSKENNILYFARVAVLRASCGITDNSGRQGGSAGKGISL